MLDVLKRLAREAGEAILDIYQTEFDTKLKGDNSPLTQADLAAHKIIVRGLELAFPDIPVLSEESSAVDWEVRRQWREYFLVDPLDGTKEFINRNGEFSVNIAFIRQNTPHAAVVYAPVLDKLYSAEKGSASQLESNGETRDLEANLLTQKRGLRIVGSRSHPSEELASFLADYPEHQMIPKGSSLKFCMLAEGEADLYPRLGLTSEWDTAAAQLILEQAGGRVIEYQSEQPLRYNQKESLLNPYFIAYARGDI